MSNILALPVMTGSLQFADNADWHLTIQFVDGAGSPIDLTGIAFRSEVRSTSADAHVVLDISSEAGSFVVDAASGRLSWAVPRAMVPRVAGDYVTDIIAIAAVDGITRNLCSSPLPVTIMRGVTR